MQSLRDSGKIVGRSVSVKQLAQQCNMSFPLSLRKYISSPDCRFSRCNRLHIKVLFDPDIAIETMLNSMREVYITAQIRVEVVSRENLTGPNFTNLLDLDVKDSQGNICIMGRTSNEQNQLFMNRNNVGANEIVVYFVRSTNPAFNGCASHTNGRPGAVIARIASQWTLAHEVGHVLDLDHISGENNCMNPDYTRLMTGCSTSNIIGTPTIDQNEINTMKSSNLTIKC